MKNETLLDLAEKWERDAVPPEVQDGSKIAEYGNNVKEGERQAKRTCADDLRELIGLLG